MQPKQTGFDRKQFRRQVTAAFAIRLLLEWSLISFALYLSTRSYWLWPVVSLLILGRGQWILMDNLGHWASHHNLFPKKNANVHMQFAYFLPNFITFKEWFAEHMAHHRHLGTEKDPEKDTFERWKLENKDGKKRWNYFLSFLLVPASDFKKNLSQLRFWRKKELAIFWCAIILLAAATSTEKMLMFWLLSYFLIRPYFMFINETAEHYKAPASNKKQQYGSRNLAGILACGTHGNAPHEFHHLFPEIPPDQIAAAYKAYLESNPETTETDFRSLKKQILQTV